jgi:hypothetical protein
LLLSESLCACPLGDGRMRAVRGIGQAMEAQSEAGIIAKGTRGTSTSRTGPGSSRRSRRRPYRHFQRMHHTKVRPRSFAGAFVVDASHVP